MYDLETLLGDGTLQGMLQAFYDAYWFDLEGRLEGVKLKQFGNMPAEQSAALEAGFDAMVAYFNDNVPA